MILDQRVFRNDSGVVEKIFWLQNWIKKPLSEVKNFLDNDEVIISHHYKYIFGFTGRETALQLKIIKVKIIEIKEEKA
ncbi:MAG: hypothetical protein KatS3mg093_301 [Candidatus Parcubacteria bacterium]|nr:MAG: hypothetical protein KatS3mg093_301 [Candidatus Parcubacteria bacterium]